MQFVVYSQWSQLPESANTLFAISEQESLFCSRRWFESLSSYALNEDQSLKLLCVLEEDNVLAILPMLESTRDGLIALSNYFSTLYSLLVSNSRPKDVILACLVEGLSQIVPHAIRIEPIDSSDDNMKLLQRLMELNGFKSHSYFSFYNWSHPINGQSFNEYMAERPGNIRNMIQRKQRKLKREHVYNIRLYVDKNIDRALLDYQNVYQKSWKANESFADFTPSLVKRLSVMGWVRLAVLYIEEKPAAAQIWFVVHGKANIYRLVYDARWKNYSPGSILTGYLMRQVIDVDKVSEIDFLTGNERYKQDWMSVRKERLGVHFVKKEAKKNLVARIVQRLKN